MSHAFGSIGILCYEICVCKKDISTAYRGEDAAPTFHSIFIHILAWEPRPRGDWPYDFYYFVAYKQPATKPYRGEDAAPTGSFTGLIYSK